MTNFTWPETQQPLQCGGESPYFHWLVYLAALEDVHLYVLQGYNSFGGKDLLVPQPAHALHFSHEIQVYHLYQVPCCMDIGKGIKQIHLVMIHRILLILVLL